MSAGVLVCWCTDGSLKVVNIPTDAEKWAAMYDSAETQAHRLLGERDALLMLLRECQPSLDHDAAMARGTPAEGVRSMLAARVRAAIAGGAL